MCDRFGQSLNVSEADEPPLTEEQLENSKLTAVGFVFEVNIHLINLFLFLLFFFSIILN